MAAMKDPDLLEDAKAQRLEISAIDGAAIHQLITGMYAMPQPVIDRVVALLTNQE
jgi:hypothetical protein